MFVIKWKSLLLRMLLGLFIHLPCIYFSLVSHFTLCLDNLLFLEMMWTVFHSILCAHFIISQRETSFSDSWETDFSSFFFGFSVNIENPLVWNFWRVCNSISPVLYGAWVKTLVVIYHCGMHRNLIVYDMTDWNKEKKQYLMPWHTRVQS